MIHYSMNDCAMFVLCVKNKGEVEKDFVSYKKDILGFEFALYLCDKQMMDDYA